MRRSSSEAIVLPKEIFCVSHGARRNKAPSGGFAPRSKEAFMIRVSTLFLLLAVLAGCETVEGFGRDVESGGEAIQDSAAEVEQGL
jgi:predicted small secreted protein